MFDIPFLKPFHRTLQTQKLFWRYWLVEQQLSVELGGDAGEGSAPERWLDCESGGSELRSPRYIWQMSALCPTKWKNCCSSTK